MFSDKLQRSKSYEKVEVPQIQFIVIVLDIPVATQRRLPTVQTVQKTGEFPQVQFLDNLTRPSCATTDVGVPLENPQVQFIDKVADVPVVQAPENCGVTQLQFSDKVDMPVVVNDRRDRAENCGGSAVAVSCWFFQFLDKVVDMPVVVQFFDMVVDVPVVLCDGVPQVQYFIAGVSGHSSLATVGYAQCKLCSLGSACGGWGGDEVHPGRVA